MSSSSEAGARDFPRFRQQPEEIRGMIWTAATSEPLFIKIETHEGDNFLRGNFLRSLQLTQTSPLPPPIFHTNSEARRVAQSSEPKLKWLVHSPEGYNNLPVQKTPLRFYTPSKDYLFFPTLLDFNVFQRFYDIQPDEIDNTYVRGTGLLEIRRVVVCGIVEATAYGVYPNVGAQTMNLIHRRSGPSGRLFNYLWNLEEIIVVTPRAEYLSMSPPNNHIINKHERKLVTADPVETQARLDRFKGDFNGLVRTEMERRETNFRTVISEFLRNVEITWMYEDEFKVAFPQAEI